MKVLHVLASNKYSGAENVVCQIIDMFNDEIDMAYCSPDGDIRKALNDKHIKFLPLEKLTKKEISKAVKEFKPDIIHAHDFKASILCSRFNKKAKIVSTIHGNKKDMDKLSLKTIVFNFFSKKLDKIIWVSKSCYEDYYFKNKVENKSITLPNIISIESLKNKANSETTNEKFDVVFVGRLVVEKNPTRLIEIANEIKKSKDDFKMCIIGDGEYRNEMQDLVNQYDLHENVVFKGFLSNPYTILANSKVMLMTSIMEGTPMSCLEALSLGVPMVSTKTDGLVEIIQQGYNGYLYDTNEESAKFILNLIADDKLLVEISDNCKAWSENYNNIENYKRKILEIYKG